MTQSAVYADNTNRPVVMSPTALGQTSMKQYTLNDFNSEGSDDDRTCPTCGRDDFASAQGMKTHHARVHGEPHPESGTYPTDTECAGCGTEIEVPKGNFEKTTENFCDECRYPPHPELECPECGGVFTCIPSRAERRKYCSYACRSQQARGKGRNTVAKIRRWIGEVSWIRVSRMARERDDYKCRMCGVEENGRGHHVHHIIPVCRGGGNTLNNVITLCPSCHKKAEPWSMTFGVELFDLEG